MKVADILNKVELINFEIASVLEGKGETEFNISEMSEVDKSKFLGSDYQNLEFDQKIDILYSRRGKLLENFGKWRESRAGEHYFQSGDKMNLQSWIDRIVLFDRKLLDKLNGKINAMSNNLKKKSAQKQVLIYTQAN
jgi:hypothetical protein